MQLRNLAVIGLVLGMMGCQTLGKPVTESTVDKELNKPAPSTSPPSSATQEQPRQGFEQESLKSQGP